MPASHAIHAPTSFRDLKPANVGFDGQGVLKLFDFGFAVGLPTTAGGEEGLLYDRCDTPRYMAPEIGLEHGYGLPSDVYSFGILLWEICALVKPFAAIASPDEFHLAVFVGGKRPPRKDRWPRAARDLMGDCWAARPARRPAMVEVRAQLAAAASAKGGGGGGGDGDGRRRRSAMKTLRSSITNITLRSSITKKFSL